MGLAVSGQPNRFLTLTVNPAYLDSPEERLLALTAAWRTLVKRLRRTHGKTELEYLAVVEKTKAGEPHLHILLRSAYLSQRVISDAMRELVQAPIVDIRRIRRPIEVVRYVAKYITKAPEHFAGGKRYWRTPSFEQHDTPYVPPADTAVAPWQVWRNTISDLDRYWTMEGFTCQHDSADHLYAIFMGNFDL